MQLTTHGAREIPGGAGISGDQPVTGSVQQMIVFQRIIPEP